MKRNTVGKMQLISRREKIHFAQLLGFNDDWRKWWHSYAKPKPVGKRRAYDHIKVGSTLCDIMPHGSDFEYKIAHQAFDCRGWRYYGVGRWPDKWEAAFAYHLPPWK